MRRFRRVPASMAVSISRDLNGRPWTLVSARASTRYLARRMLHSWPGVEFGHDHLAVAGEDLAEIGRQRIEVDEMDRRHLVAGTSAALDRGVDRCPRRAPADHQHVGIDVAAHVDRRDVGGDRGDLGGAQVDHPLVVLRRVVDVAGAVGLLQPADAVHQPGRTGDRPRTGQRHLVAQVRPELRVAVVVDVVELGGERHGDVGQRRDVGQLPRFRTVGEVAVGQQDHRGAVLERDADGLDRRLEAVRRAVRRDHRERCLAVAAEQCEVEVGRLGLGRADRSTVRRVGCRRSATAARPRWRARWSRS